MIGKNGKIKFVFVDKRSNGPKVTFKTVRDNTTQIEEQPEVEKAKAEFAWKVATEPPNIQYLDLNEDSFSDLLMRVIFNLLAKVASYNNSA